MKSKSLAGLVLVLVFTAIGAYGQKSRPFSPADGEVFNKIKNIEGKVTILNHPTLGKTVASGQYLVFQREGCKECLTATHADGDGNFQIFLGVGKYRLIASWCYSDPVGNDLGCVNYLSADQPEYITVDENNNGSIKFNINLVAPKD